MWTGCKAMVSRLPKSAMKTSKTQNISCWSWTRSKSVFAREDLRPVNCPAPLKNIWRLKKPMQNNLGKIPLSVPVVAPPFGVILHHPLAALLHTGGIPNALVFIAPPFRMMRACPFGQILIPPRRGVPIALVIVAPPFGVMLANQSCNSIFPVCSGPPSGDLLDPFGLRLPPPRASPGVPIVIAHCTSWASAQATVCTVQTRESPE